MKTSDLLKITFPAIILQSIEMGSMFIDAIMIGNYDPIKFGATSLAGAIFYFFHTFFYGVLLMIGPLIGQAKGAGNKQLITRNVQGGIVIGAIFSITMYIICVYIVEITSILNFSPEIITTMDNFIAGKKYTAFAFLVLPLRYFLINQGVFRQVLSISLLIFPLNIILNYVLIYGYGAIPEMGVYGAGLATSISILISAFTIIPLSNIYAKRNNFHLYKDFFKLDIEIYKRILTYGIPSGIATVLEMLLFTTNNIYVAYFDSYSISAFATMFQLWNISWAIAVGFCEGVGILIATSAGTRQYDEIKIILKKSFITLSIIILCICSTYYFLLDYTYGFILDKQSPAYVYITEIANSLTYLLIIAIIFESFVHLPLRFLYSINDTKYIPIAQFIGYGLVGPVLGYLLCFVYDFKNQGLFVAMIVAVVVTLAILIARSVYSLNPERIFTKVATK